MEQWNEIRRKVLVEGVSKRPIRRDYGIGWQALDKILAHPEPPGYQMAEVPPKARARALHLAMIDEILADDKEAPPKQRHTARRIFDRLRDEHGYTGSELPGPRRWRKPRRRRKEVFVPLSQPPGEAQFDFGEATVEIDGVRVKAALAVMTLPYSDAFFVSAYPRECTETFQAGHVAAFEFFGGVPTKTAYDNTTIAVSQDHRAERADAHQRSSCASRATTCSPPLLPGGTGQREGPRREPRRLWPAQLPRAGAVVRVLRRAERAPRSSAVSPT